MNENAGLRERKKAATRSALSLAALHLAVRCGLEAVTADDIAAAADVSVRTFHNYFNNKEEAIASAFHTAFQVYADEFRNRPADEPILDSLEHIAVLFLETNPAGPVEPIAHLRALGANPDDPSVRIAFEEVERMFIQIVADRTGTSVDTDLYPYVVTAALGAAVRVAIETPMARASPDPTRLVYETFAILRAGLAEPVH